MTTGTGAGTIPRIGAREDTAPEPLLTRPGLVVPAVVAAWCLVPSLAAGPRLNWLLTGALACLVANALWRHARSLRWPWPVTLVAVLLLCGTLSTSHHGTLTGLVTHGSGALLLLGCALLAANAGPADVRLLGRGLVVVGLAELAVGLASTLFGTPAPWGYLGTPGSLFETNPLLPAVGGRVTGTMAHPLPFGALLALTALLALLPVLRWPVPARLLVGAAGCGGVVLSGSRSAALALLLAVAVAMLTPGVLRIGPLWRTVAVLVSAGALLTVQVGTLPVVAGLQGTGSLTHRLGALDAAVRLFGRPPAETLLGSGTGSLPDLFDAGYLQLDGFFAVDNQFVATFGTAGLVGVAALAALVVSGLRRGQRATRPAALLLVVMFLSFDVLEWNAVAVVAVALLVLGTARPSRDGEPQR
ncbi:hypothetical protein ACI79J_10995 [Geodermatophilus sp. SYSU D01062]